MIEDLKNLLKYNHIEIYTPMILDQLRTFIQHQNGKLAAAQGKKDDLVLALMIAVQMARNVQIRKETEVPKIAPRGSADWFYAQANKRREGFNRLKVC
jgi:hypothetical protein